MIENLKPYTEYKESGLPWLGEVPGNWEIRRMKSMAENVINHTKELNTNDLYLALEHVESWTGKAKPQSGSFLFSGQAKRFRCNDVLFCKLRPYLAKVTRIPAHGVCSGEFFVIRTFENNLSSAYLEYLLRSKNIIDVINGSTFGAKMPRADWQFCGNLSVPLPPPAEQTAIVRFLDWANHRLERAIRAKRKVIALLNEQKQAIIHRAVTRGLDPNVRLKDSGIPWLGEIPEHWEVRRLKCLAYKFGSGITPRGGSTIYQEQGIPLLRSQNVHFGELRLEKVARIPMKVHQEMSGTHVQPKDVLLNITGASIGRVCSVPLNLIEANVNQHVCIIRPIQELCDSKFLALFLSTSAAQTAIYLAQNGSSREGLTISSVKALAVLKPPLNEQKQIASGIHDKTKNISNAISRLEREITLLREYRTRLISDVVTGKLDVREAAARLPEEVPLETETDTDDTDPGEEADIPQEDNDL